MIAALSLDGGGIRGYITALFLAHLEDALGVPLHKVFDLIVGNSTGGILALGLAAELPAEVIAKMYAERGHAIFKPRFPRVAWWRRERYDYRIIEEELRTILGDTRMRQAKTRTVVFSYDLHRRCPHNFASWGRGKNETMVRAARATSAAPGFFEPLDGRYIDGGMGRNNPAVRALAIAHKQWLGEPMVLVSVGTGEATRPLAHADIKGLAKLAPKLVELFMDGQADAADEDARDLADLYFRFQQRLDIASDDFDDASPENIANLGREAMALIAASGEQVADLVQLLKGKK